MDRGDSLLSGDSLLRRVMTTQYFAVLNTAGGGLPRSCLISFAAADDLKSLVFVTRRDTQKYRDIQENQEVSLLVDNRTNKPADVYEATAIEVIGTAHEDTDNSSDLKGVLIGRHPQLQQFAEAPDNAFILVRVREYVISGFDATRRVIVPQ